MLRSLLVALLIAFSTGTSFAGDDAVTIRLTAPAGWKGETIAVPTGFAPDMSITGIEEIRFAPGMFKQDRDDFFSYALVFYLPNQKPLNELGIQRELLKYYRGLAKVVGKNRQPKIDTDAFTFDIKLVKDDPLRYTGTLKWVEPFTTGKAQTLYFELHSEGVHGTQASQLSMSVSPQKTDHALWKTLRAIQSSARFEQPDRPDKSSTNWPSFRGVHASGVADGQDLPLGFDAETGKNIRYKIPIPGLAHSSPIVWGDRLFLTTAVSSEENASFKPGLYGSGEASADRSVHEWRVICLDKRSGKTLWQKTAVKAEPVDKRHVKATYANATPATDGKHIIAMFGSHGLYAFSVEGEALWHRDLGRLDVGAYDLPQYEWGSASSPIIYKNLVIVQCDSQKDSFIVALDIATGETVWRTERDELPSWGTPTIFPHPERPELITNGSNFIRGYDPTTGKELWRLGGSSKITAPTPVFADGLIVVASGRAPERPLFAIRSGAEGDITLGRGKTKSAQVAWLKSRRGPYMPTPLIYRGIVYVINNSGQFGAYDLKTGDEHYYERVPQRSHGFSASPIAADGRVYLFGEDGRVFIVKAGDTFELISTHTLGETVMATPALSEGTMYIRGADHLFAIGK